MEWSIPSAECGQSQVRKAFQRGGIISGIVSVGRLFIITPSKENILCIICCVIITQIEIILGTSSISYFPHLSAPPSSQGSVSNRSYGCFLISWRCYQDQCDYKWEIF